MHDSTRSDVDVQRNMIRDSIGRQRMLKNIGTHVGFVDDGRARYEPSIEHSHTSTSAVDVISTSRATVVDLAEVREELTNSLGGADVEGAGGWHAL